MFKRKTVNQATGPIFKNQMTGTKVYPGLANKPLENNFSLTDISPDCGDMNRSISSCRNLNKLCK